MPDETTQEQKPRFAFEEFSFEERGLGVRKLRRDLDLSQATLARRVGCHQSLLSQFESGDKDLSEATFQRLMECLADARLDARQQPAHGRLVHMLNYSFKDYQRDSALTSPPYRTALADKITELQGECARLRFYLARVCEQTNALQEITKQAAAEEGKAILARECPAEVSDGAS
jgi:transcriptional regulator with XRE-family HTH domain